MVSGKRLNVYLRENIFQPLGMKDTDFVIGPDQKKRLVTVHSRKADGGLDPIEFGVPQQPEFFMGGGGLYSGNRIMLREKAESKNEIARFCSLRPQNLAISNPPIRRKQTLPQRLGHCSRTTFDCLFRPDAPFPHLHQITFEEVTQECTGNCNGGESADVVPGWRDRCPHDVRCELERQSGNQVARIIKPDFAYRFMQGRPQDHSGEAREERLDRSHGDNRHRHRLNSEGNVTRRNA
jgi:Beta-lactamase